MRLKIISWTIKNTRAADMKIDLASKNDNNEHCFIRMENGTGKTTTLTLLKMTLSGKVAMSESEIREFQPRNKARNSGFCEVVLSYDNKLCSIKMTLDYQDGTVAYRTSHQDAKGVINDFRPPAELVNYLRPEYVDLFFFNGEEISSLVGDKSSTNQNAIKGLETVLGFSVFDEINKAISTYYLRKEEEAEGIVSDQALTGLRNKQLSEQARYKKLNNKYKKAQKTFDEQTKILAKLEEEKSAKIRGNLDLEERQKKLKEDLDTNSSELDEIIANLMPNLRNPNKISAVVLADTQSLKKSYDKAKLPESTSKQFFIDLADEKICVCGREIESTHREIILEKSKSFLGSDDISVINQVKENIPDNLDLYDIKKTEKNLRDLINTRNTIESNLKGFGSEGVTEELANYFKEWNSRQDLAIEKKNEAENTISHYEQKSKSGKDHLKTLEKANKKRAAEIASRAGILTVRQNKDELHAILGDAKSDARERLVKILVDKTNDKLNGIHNLRLSDVKNKLIFDGQTGGSEGQNFSTGYCFISSLLERSGDRLPFVVDFPCGSLDSKKRSGVGKVLPTICNQFITFIIDTEVPHFVETFQKHMKEGEINFIHVISNEDKSEVKVERGEDAFFKNLKLERK